MASSEAFDLTTLLARQGGGGPTLSTAEPCPAPLLGGGYTGAHNLHPNPAIDMGAMLVLVTPVLITEDELELIRQARSA